VLEEVGNARIVIMSPLAADPVFTREFADPRVSFELLPPHRPSGLEARLLSIVQARYFGGQQTETLRIKLAAGHPGAHVRARRAKSIVGRVIAPAGDWYRWTDRVVHDREIEAAFARIRPTLVAVATPGLSFAEIPLLRTARRRRIRTMAVDLSWDNLTNKLLPIRRVDRLVVWNSTMKQEACELHGYPPDAIDVAGAPQFDGYFAGARRTSREDFCARVGLDPSRRILALTTIPAEAYPRHDLVIDHLLEAIRAGAIQPACDVLVRLHPRDDMKPYERFAGAPHLAVEKPFRASARSADGHGVDVTAENTRHLADTMYHSDVVLNVASTIAIEASIFDRPVVNIAFDQDDAEVRPFLTSPLRYYSYTHYQQIVRAGAVRIAKSPAEMIAWVNAYLANPALDAEGRRRVTTEQCEFTDGRSAARVGHCMADSLRRSAVSASAHIVHHADAASPVHLNVPR
jgi:hypothetical protein